MNISLTLKDIDDVTILEERLTEFLAILKNKGGRSLVIEDVLDQVRNILASRVNS